MVHQPYAFSRIERSVSPWKSVAAFALDLRGYVRVETLDGGGSARLGMGCAAVHLTELQPDVTRESLRTMTTTDTVRIQAPESSPVSPASPLDLPPRFEGLPTASSQTVAMNVGCFIRIFSLRGRGTTDSGTGSRAAGDLGMS